MRYVTTNIRILEEDYLRLKGEAARKRTSFSAIIREKVSERKSLKKKLPEQIMKEVRKHAAENAKDLKGIDGVKIIRDMRDNAKW